MKPGAFIDRFLVGADRPLEAGANAWVKETIGRRETMVQNAYATGLKVWVPNDEMEPSPKRYFYGTGLMGHMAIDKDGRFVLVNDDERRVYMSSVACYEADAYYALLRGRRIWVGMITAFDHRTGLVSVSFWDSQVDPTDLVKLVSNEPVTGAGRSIVDASHLSSSLLGRKAHGYTYVNARPDDTYPESRYEHVSTSTTESTESTEPTEPAGSENAGETGEPDEADEAGETGETDTDAEFDRLLSSVTHAPPAPTRLIYPPLKPPRRIRTRRASNRKRRS
jgi:hypothetical protein